MLNEKDTAQNESVSNGQSIAQQIEKSFYERRNSMSVIIKKTEKITTAIYMVTDFISEVEPLRPRLRTLALDLLAKTRTLGSHSAQTQYALSDDVSNVIDGINVYINLGATIGLLSEMNAKILTTELEKITVEIKSIYPSVPIVSSMHPGYRDVVLTQEMFEVKMAEGSTAHVPYNGHVLYKGQSQIGGVQYNKDIPIYKKDESVIKKGEIGIKIARRNDVLNVVKAKGKVSIKDVAHILKNVSEKTVQRELHALVSEGVLIKEGEKRWSVYKIAS